MATLAEKLHQEGLQEGLLAGLRTSLTLRFGAEGLALMPRIETIHDPKRLQRLLERILEVDDLEPLRAELD